MRNIQWLIIVISITVSLPSPENVRLDLSLSSDKMTLTCLVKNRNSKSNIYLACPFAAICKENCKRNCVNETNEGKCMADKMIQCRDRGFNSSTGLYIVEYIIDASDSRNNGPWKCSYAISSSSIVYVNSHKSKPTPTVVPILQIMTKPTKPTVQKPSSKELTIRNLSLHKREHCKGVSENDERRIPFNSNKMINRESQPQSEYSKLLAKSEFILSVIGLLAVSLIFNVYFCARILFIKCKSKKSGYNNEDYFSMHQNQRPLNRCNSQASDPERIYEDTSTTLRQMSFLSKIKKSNGNYVGQNSLSPCSSPPTILPPNFLPLNHSLSFPGPQTDSGCHLATTPTQIYYPLPTDPNHTNYAAMGLRSENQYTNFLSVQPELNHRDQNNQPLYLAFTSGHPFMAANGRYLQYSNQPLQMTTESSLSSNMKPSPVPSQVKNGYVSASNSEQENYQLSREMMEEADNLLRTADTLLKSTQQEMEMIK